MKYFIVIDMQNDFCTGALANPEAVKIIPNIKKELISFIEKEKERKKVL
jgi:nicotinamidase-related amidase